MAHSEESDPVSPPASGQQPPRININPMELLLGMLMTSGDDKWYKAERISRKDLHEKYPHASHFRKTNANIAAIDFGTTFCSLAFTTEGDTGAQISTLRLDGYLARVPTAILLKESSTSAKSRDDLLPISRTCDYDVVAFGYEAMELLCSARPSQRAKFLFFERFKMTLQQDEVNCRGMYYVYAIMICVYNTHICRMCTET